MGVLFRLGVRGTGLVCKGVQTFGCYLARGSQLDAQDGRSSRMGFGARGTWKEDALSRPRLGSAHLKQSR